ncbi:MAG: hypothetical protein H7144_09550 [Burkholderiales bacterium]|nr:hypothetical protein [Phycisphaerae bacterium]
MCALLFMCVDLGQFEPLIDLATFHQVRERGTEFKVYHKPQMTFAGRLMICSHCGRAVIGEHKIKKSPNGTQRGCAGYATGEHPRSRLTEAQIDDRLLAFFKTIRIEDAEVRQWFVEVIKARAQAGQADNKQYRIDIQRQHEQVESKIQTLLEMRIENEITQDEFASKRRQLQDRQAAIRLQLEITDRDNDQVADLAIKAFELSQSLTEKWLNADYNAKHTILSIMLETVRLNFGNLEFCPRKPFDLLRNENFVPLSGGGGN